MPLLKNAKGRIVAVSQSRVKPLIKEGFEKATDEEVKAWQDRHQGDGGDDRGFSLPEGYEYDLNQLIKSELVKFAATHYDLDLDESDTKKVLVASIMGAAEATERAMRPEVDKD